MHGVNARFAAGWLLVALVLATPLAHPTLAWAQQATAQTAPQSSAKQDCLAAFAAKNYAKALPLCQAAAKQGDAEAQFLLGVMYNLGEGVAQDFAQAVAWFRKAAEQGFARGQYNLGLVYNLGQGVAQDFAQALAWYHKAAEQGHARAQLNLGVMYVAGQGVAQDYVRAFALFDMAAALGNETAAKNRTAIAARMTAQQVSTAQALAQSCKRQNYKNCGF